MNNIMNEQLALTLGGYLDGDITLKAFNQQLELLGQQYGLDVVGCEYVYQRSCLVRENPLLKPKFDLIEKECSK